MGFSFGGGFGGLSGLGSGGIGDPIFSEEGFLVGFEPGIGLGIFGLDIGGAISTEGFGGFSVGPGGVLIPPAEVSVEAPSQEDINAAIEAEIAAERAADAERFGGGGGEDPEGGGPAGIGFPNILGGLGQQIGGGFTLEELQTIAAILDVPVSSILETETPVDEPDRGEPPEEGVPADVEDREPLPPCDPRECPPTFGLPPFILRPTVEILRRLTLQFPLNIELRRNFQFLQSLASGEGAGVLGGPPDIVTSAADDCGFFAETFPRPVCRCVCQTPVRSCCGGGGGCDCEPC